MTPTIPMRARRGSAGFTLMEVLVATSLTAMLMSILFLGLRLGASAMQHGQRKLDEQTRAVAGMDLLERQITSAVPRVVVEKHEREVTRYVAFRGAAQQARFLSARSWQGDRAWPLYLAEYRVKELPAGGEQLVISERGISDEESIVRNLSLDPLRFALVKSAPPREEEIGEPAGRIEFQYLQPATPQAPTQWVNEWSGEQHDAAPRAVRVLWTRGKAVESATFLVAIARDPRLENQ